MSKDSKIDDISAELFERISQNYYFAGQRLPSERELAEELDVSRATIRAALARLQSENIVDVIPRGGAFVRSSTPKATIGTFKPLIHKGSELAHAGSFIRAMETQGRKTFVRFIEPSSIIPAGDEIAAKMGIQPNTEILRRYRIHIVEKVPYRILDSYYLAPLLGELVGKDEGYIPLFKWLRDHQGIRAAKAFEQFNCRMPSAQEAAFLHICRSQPVIDMDRFVWSDSDQLFEYSHIIANAALHEFGYSYDIGKEASE